MKLKQALKRAFALLPKDTNFNKVLFVSSPASVFVTNGLCSTIVFVDDPLSDFLCDASVLVKAVKDKGDFRFRVIGNGFCQIETTANQYTVMGEDTSLFPRPVFPDYDLFDDSIDLRKLQSVIYGASKSSKDEGLPYLHFADLFVESTDRVRLIKELVRFRWSGLLPIGLFNKWPKKFGEGGFYFDGYRAFFRLGDEIRYAFPVKDKYPDTQVATTIGEGNGTVVLARKEILDIVKQANEVSDIKGVHFTFGDKVEVRALGRESVLDYYYGSSELDKPLVPGEVAVSGKLLSQSLRNIKTQLVTFIYNKYPSPLVIRGEQTLVYIWPMLNE